MEQTQYYCVETIARELWRMADKLDEWTQSGIISHEHSYDILLNLSRAERSIREVQRQARLETLEMEDQLCAV